MDLKIPIHIVSSYFYCPFKPYLEYRRIKGIETKDIIIGRKWHENLEREHMKRANIKISIIDALKRSIKEDKVYIFREVPIDGNIFYGRIDELWIHPSYIMILDDKPGLTFGYKMQVVFYAHSFATTFLKHLDRPILLGIRRRENKKLIWKEAFERKHVFLVKKYSRKIISSVMGEFPIDDFNPRKCEKCSYRDVCPFRNLFIKYFKKV